MLRQRPPLKAGMLVLLTASLVGCVSSVKMFPITDKDIFLKDDGTVCMSEYYFNTVLQAKIERKR